MTDEQIRNMIFELLEQIDYDLYKDIKFGIEDNEESIINRMEIFVSIVKQSLLRARHDSAGNSINNIR